jgi:hypothetical protein
LRLAAGKESGQWSDTIPANIQEFFEEWMFKNVHN